MYVRFVENNLILDREEKHVAKNMQNYYVYSLIE